MANEECFSNLAAEVPVPEWGSPEWAVCLAQMSDAVSLLSYCLCQMVVLGPLCELLLTCLPFFSTFCLFEEFQFSLELF